MGGSMKEEEGGLLISKSCMYWYLRSLAISNKSWSFPRPLTSTTNMVFLLEKKNESNLFEKMKWFIEQFCERIFFYALKTKIFSINFCTLKQTSEKEKRSLKWNIFLGRKASHWACFCYNTSSEMFCMKSRKSLIFQSLVFCLCIQHTLFLFLSLL